MKRNIINNLSEFESNFNKSKIDYIINSSISFNKNIKTSH